MEEKSSFNIFLVIIYFSLIIYPLFSFLRFSNAVIHGYEGQLHGKVDLEFALLSPDTLMIKVIDKGVGIENIARAMEPLFTTDTGEERSGMGFTVMESFMDKIKVDSDVGVGTTVTMIKKIDTYDGI